MIWCSHNPASSFYPLPKGSSPHSHLISLCIIMYYYYYHHYPNLSLGLPTHLLPWGYPAKYLYFSHLPCMKHPARIFPFDLNTPIIFGEEYVQIQYDWNWMCARGQKRETAVWWRCLSMWETNPLLQQQSCWNAATPVLH